jgi:DNA-directed RNA polymerase specialized sigma24 family protein
VSRSDADAVENLGGWLTTVVARISLNMLRSRTARREEPQGTDLPDGIAGAVWAVGGEPRVVFRFRSTQAQVSAIEMLSDPATLGELDLEMLPA